MVVNFKEEIDKRINIFNGMDESSYQDMSKITDLMTETLRKGNKIITAGNGGSSANAMHLTGDIVGRYKMERPAYAGITLTVEPCVITAVSNDYSYAELYARELEGIGKEGDCLILYSSSGNSDNLTQAAQQAKKMGINVVGLLGNHGGELKEKDLLTASVTTKKMDSDLSEEFSMALSHIMMVEVERRLVEEK